MVSAHPAQKKYKRKDKKTRQKRIDAKTYNTVDVVNQQFNFPRFTWILIKLIKDKKGFAAIFNSLGSSSGMSG